MSRLGSHQLIDPHHFRHLRSLPTDADRIQYVDEVLDEFYDQNIGTDYDKAWPLLHSALQGSNPCSDYLERNSRTPASWAIMGSEDIAVSNECMINGLGRWQTKRVNWHLQWIGADDIRKVLNSLIEKHGCENLSDEDADYAAHWYPRLQSFFQRASKRHWPVIFRGDLA